MVNIKILDLESKASGLIEMLVVIITGIGISFTTVLLILKRKKDHVLLAIYGMKEKMLRDLIFKMIILMIHKSFNLHWISKNWVYL